MRLVGGAGREVGTDQLSGVTERNGGVAVTPSQHASIAAHESWARTPPAERTLRTRPALLARIAKYEKQVDPEGRMSPEDRAVCARNAMRADMRRLAARSVATHASKSAARRRSA